ncbi:hypothetical protein [Segetibacter koreensis]|uniref:hypothetical protein n=1 Tax=Segetibacter koreensis TaxID=398037 RepID=UPI00036AD9D7|nr:hypothetical protein [Segetibacter koreensis]
MTFKENVYNQCKELLNNKIHLLRQTLNDLKESASNETKSTAGDKHETALAMLQIDQENTNKQLENLLLQKLLIEKIIPTIQPQRIANGTLVKTNKGYLFVSIPLGKITVEGTTVIVLSPQSPLGSKLIGLNINENTTINGMTYVIEDIK